MKNYSDFENLSLSERLARFAVSMVVIIGAMESSLVGTTLFAVVNLLAIGLTTTAIIAWDPAKSLAFGSKALLSAKHDHHRGHHA